MFKSLQESTDRVTGQKQFDSFSFNFVVMNVPDGKSFMVKVVSQELNGF